MKKLKFLIYLLLISDSIQAQKFYSFIYKEKTGIVNDNAIEMVEPLYDYFHYIEDKKIWVLIPRYDEHEMQTCTFNEKNNEKKYYKTFYTDAVKIGGETYSEVEDSKDQYLWSEISDKKIFLKKKYDSPRFKNIGGRYILCSYYGYIKTNPAAPVPQRNTKGMIKFKPPVLETPVAFIDVMANNESIPVLISGQYNSCKPLLAYDEESAEFYLNPDPAGLLCSNGNTHILYDASLKKIATFTKEMPKEDDNEMPAPRDRRVTAMLAYCSKLLNTNVVFNYPVYPAISTRLSSSEEKKEEPKAYIETEKMDTGTLLYINHPEGFKTRVLLLSPKFEIGHSDNWIEITKQSEAKPLVSFAVDMSNGKILLPEKYVRILGLTND
nr:hypothetical protein [Flavobacterium sp. ASV13]